MKNTFIFLCLISFLVGQACMGQDISTDFQKPKMQQSQQFMANSSSMTSNQDGLSSSGRTEENYTADQELGMYMYDDWNDGQVFLADNSSLDNIKLRYNIYYKQMQFIQGEDTMAFSSPDEIKGIAFNGHEFIHSSFYGQRNTIDDDYFEVLVAGDVQLLKRRIITYHINPEETSKTDNECYVKCCGLYLKEDGQPARKLNCNKKGIRTAFKDHEDIIMDFVKSNDLKVKNQEDLEQLVEFYNTLI